jgi:hypothetical protein
LLLLLVLAPVGSSATKQKLFWLLKLILLLLLGTKTHRGGGKTHICWGAYSEIEEKTHNFHAKNQGPIHIIEKQKPEKTRNCHHKRWDSACKAQRWRTQKEQNGQHTKWASKQTTLQILQPHKNNHEVSDYFKAVDHCSCISGAPLPAVCNTLFLQSGGGPYFHLFKKIFTASSVCHGIILQISDFMLVNICQVSMHPR